MRTRFLLAAALLVLAGLVWGVGRHGQREAAERPVPDTSTGPFMRSDAEWKKLLTPEQFSVCRLKGTEPRFSGPLVHEHRDGTYYCVACGNKLFVADSKFDSGTGWPSFFQPASRDAVAINTDHSHGMVRDEVTCSRCGSHLGHVFNDGPPPTGLRYCMNSVSLRFEPAPGAAKASDQQAEASQ